MGDTGASGTMSPEVIGTRRRVPTVRRQGCGLAGRTVIPHVTHPLKFSRWELAQRNHNERLSRCHSCRRCGRAASTKPGHIDAFRPVPVPRLL